MERSEIVDLINRIDKINESINHLQYQISLLNEEKIFCSTVVTRYEIVNSKEIQNGTIE